MKHRVPHHLDFEAAKRATTCAFDSYIERFQQYNPTARWMSEKTAQITFSVKGVQMKGSLELEATAIAIDISVPFLFRIFQSKAVEVVEREIRHWVTKAEKGEI